MLEQGNCHSKRRKYYFELMKIINQIFFRKGGRNNTDKIYI